MTSVIDFFMQIGYQVADAWNTVTFHSVAGEILVPLAAVALSASVEVVPAIRRRMRRGRAN